VCNPTELCVKRCDKIFVAPFLYLLNFTITAIVIGYIIKNVGKVAKGIEINPPMLRMVDTENQYHLRGLPEGETVGTSFKEGLGKNFVLLILRRSVSK
jgi:hypothetical protein